MMRAWPAGPRNAVRTHPPTAARDGSYGDKVIPSIGKNVHTRFRLIFAENRFRKEKKTVKKASLHWKPLGISRAAGSPLTILERV